MKVVKVYGALRKKLGQCRFQFEASTPAEAFKALCVNFPGLDKWLLDSEKDGISYRVTIGKEKIDENNYPLVAGPWSEREVLSITPVLSGAGGGGANIGIGIGLVALAILAAPLGGGFLGLGAGAFGSSGAAAVGGVVGLGGSLGTAASGFILGAAASSALGLVGLGLVVSGIAQAISPSPVNSTASVNTYERGRDAAKFESFTFSGIVNTEKQGLPVPIIYGRCFTGSSVISVGIDVDQLI
jgi:predicted phage tail protein